MHIVCFIKQVPDTAEVKIDPETNTLIRSGVESIANPFDVVAVEEAVRLREQYGGKISAFSMGPPQAESVLREALSLGVDEAVLLSDRSFAGADTLATSYTLARTIEKLSEKEPVDLVLCGKQAIDGDTAQTGPGIATRLGYTQLTYVVDIQWIDRDARKLQVKRKIEGGFEIVRGRLPAVVTVELELARPRRAALPQLIRSLRADIPIWNARAIQADPVNLGLKGSPTWVKKIFSPPAREGGPKFDAQSDLQDAVKKSLDVLLSDNAYAAQLLSRWERHAQE